MRLAKAILLEALVIVGFSATSAVLPTTIYLLTESEILMFVVLALSMMLWVKPLWLAMDRVFTELDRLVLAMKERVP